MNDLLIGLLTALLSTNSPSTTASNLLQVKARTSLLGTNVADPTELAFKRLMALDDQAREEIDVILQRSGETQDKKPELKPISLDVQLEQKVAPVRRAYEDFIARNPRHGRARIAYGSFLSEISEEKAGAEQWLKAKEINPDEPSVWNNLANYYGHHGPMTNALVHYARAIQLDPTESVYYQNLATTMYLYRVQTAEFLGKTVPEVMELSMATYRKALELDPDDVQLANDVAQSYYGLPGFKGAKTPEQLQLQHRISEEALTAWTNVFRLSRDDIERQAVQLHFARLSLHLGRRDQALAALNSVTNAMFTATKKALTAKLENKPASGNP